MTTSIQIKKGGFSDAREFFREYGNRDQLVALLDGSNDLLTFFVWNQRAEIERELLERNKEKLLFLLSSGNKIVFENWDEYTEEYIQFCSKNREWKNEIFLSGRNWELSGFFQKYNFLAKIPDDMLVVNKNGIMYPSEEVVVWPLQRLKERYLNKSIYVYVGSTAYLCNKGFVIQPDGYCALHARKEITYFMGKDVKDEEEVMNRPDILIVVAEQAEKEILSRVISDDKVVVYDELFEWNAEVIGKQQFQGWGTKEEAGRFKRDLTINVPYREYHNKNDVDGILFWEGVTERTPARFREYMKQVNKK